MTKDLRDFIKLLKEKAPEELMIGEKLVDPKFEARTVLRKLELANKYPMAIFKNAKDLRGGKICFSPGDQHVRDPKETRARPRS